MTSNFQKFRGTVEFSYEAEVFPEDPSDLGQLELLEADDLADYFSQYIEDTLFKGEFKNIRLEAV